MSGFLLVIVDLARLELIKLDQILRFNSQLII